MPRKATILRVLVSSPSDVLEERNALKDIIFEWNANNSLYRSILLEPVLWESHVLPEIGSNPQNLINKEIVDNSDILIGIFWCRLGTPTAIDESGTSEEINRFVNQGKPALLYFSTKPIPREHIDFNELQRLEKFKERCSKSGLISYFKDIEEFKYILANHLSHIVDKFGDKSYSTKHSQISSTYTFIDDKKRLEIQAERMQRLDRVCVDYALAHLTNHDITSIRVMDVGCADGYVTNKLFGNIENSTILGIDKSRAAIQEAIASYKSDTMDFKIVDIEKQNQQLGKFDIIFCAFTIHHLANPEGILNKLWSMLSDHGVLMVRTTDDALKVSYPPDKKLEYLVNVTNTIKGSSDRYYGRKLYSHLYNLNPSPKETKFDFFVDSTAGATKEQRMNFFDYIFSYRAKYSIKNANETNNERDIEQANELTKIIRDQRMRFETNPSIFSLNVIIMGMAFK